MLLRNKIEIEEWLHKHYVQNYELIEDTVYGYVVNVNGNVDISNQKLKSIDVKFNIVFGHFECEKNNLESLLGCPNLVGGFFDCSYNDFVNLKGSPEKIGGAFFCNCNKLESLIGFPSVINNMVYLNGNNLTMSILKYLNLNMVTEITKNKISFANNPKLGELQNVDDFNEIKKILTIYQEKENLDKLLNKNNTTLINKEVTNKLVESTDRIKIIEKIKKL